ncbi:hypothetical protein [Phaeobacter sp. B1627]|uniref:hypothetical protein n=1 Tax=Phaeobacter sp. B1627 TaxID=2583809 RepID=UPI001117BF95|nr:hypothetical protein [Phaeobacter sp. B1627]TNJ42048.1 hypothetical protein FGE21_12345 [Phaeobacter sp. B1627]
MSTPRNDPEEIANLPSVAARYKAASNTASSQQLARAMAQLQKSAAGAVFPREVRPNDQPAPKPSLPKAAKTRESAELAVMTRRGHFGASEREASRRYAGAKAII